MQVSVEVSGGWCRWRVVVHVYNTELSPSAVGFIARETKTTIPMGAPAVIGWRRSSCGWRHDGARGRRQDLRCKRRQDLRCKAPLSALERRLPWGRPATCHLPPAASRIYAEQVCSLAVFTARFWSKQDAKHRSRIHRKAVRLSWLAHNGLVQTIAGQRRGFPGLCECIAHTCV